VSFELVVVIKHFCLSGRATDTRGGCSTLVEEVVLALLTVIVWRHRRLLTVYPLTVTVDVILGIRPSAAAAC
jgi:hypothetical protein